MKIVKLIAIIVILISVILLSTVSTAAYSQNGLYIPNQGEIVAPSLLTNDYITPPFSANEDIEEIHLLPIDDANTDL